MNCKRHSIKTFEQSDIDHKMVNHHLVTVVVGPMGNLIGMVNVPEQSDAVAVVDVFDLKMSHHETRISELIENFVLPKVEADYGK